jgi:Ca2+-binding RTX toxin-like protein
MLRRLLPITVLAGAALFAPSPAAAAVACIYDPGTSRVTISMSTTEDQAGVRRIGNAIGVGGTGLPFAACGTARVTNTNRIVVNATGPGRQVFQVSLEDGQFRPGRSAEGTGVSEIEIEVNLGFGTDYLWVDGDSVAENFRFGTLGANLNGDGDLDVDPNGVDGLVVGGGGGDDRIGLQGGLGTGSAYSFPTNPAATETTLEGHGGNDTLTGGPIRETFYGGPGRDLIKGGGGEDLMYGDTGADRLEGGADGDGLYPEEGDDVIVGGAGSDYYGSEATADGRDTFSGGPGSDTASYFDRVGDVRVDLDSVADDGLAGEGDNIRRDVENLTSGDGDDRLIGNGAANQFFGEGGADRLDGLGGNDELNAGASADADADRLNGGADDDTLEGGGGADVLNGGADEDFLDDGPGNDEIDAGSGRDSISQGAAANGADTIEGGSGFDSLLYSSRGIGVNVSVNNTANDGQAGELDNVLSDVEVVEGSPVGDVLSGNALPNFLVGHGGADDIFGFDGADRLFGEAGTDDVTGGDGLDYLNGGADADNVFASDSNRDEVDGDTGTDSCNIDVGLDVVLNCP